MPQGVKGFQKGSLNPSTTPERRKILSERQKGKIPSFETRMKASITLKKVLQDPKIREERRIRATGRKHSQETKTRMRETWAKKPRSKRTIHGLAWTAWSRHRRKSAADWRGYVKCFTCEKLFVWQQTDLGHYKHRKLDFDEMNTQIQCTYCNRWRHGNLDVYSMKLIDKYGIDAIKDLHLRANIHPGYSIDELKQVIDKYKPS